MSIPSNLKSPTRSGRHDVDFLKSELALCFTFSMVAAVKYQAGKRKSAERSIAHAEKAYSTVLKFLSDPKHSQRLPQREIQRLTAELERLRERLAGLRRNVATAF